MRLSSRDETTENVLGLCDRPFAGVLRVTLVLNNSSLRTSTACCVV